MTQDHLQPFLSVVSNAHRLQTYHSTTPTSSSPFPPRPQTPPRGRCQRAPPKIMEEPLPPNFPPFWPKYLASVGESPSWDGGERVYRNGIVNDRK